MGVLQLSLTIMALVSCSFEGELSDCLEDEGFSLLLEVLSQLSADGTLSASTIDEVERVLLGRCSNDSRRDPLSRREIVCVDAVGEIVGQLRTNRSPAQPRNSSSFDECDNPSIRGWLNVGLLSIAFIILVVLSFTKTRSSFHKDFLWGIPGIVIPVNLLQSKQNHFIYIIIFGALASDVLANIFNPSTEFLAEGYDSVWYSTLIFYVQVLLQTLYFAPLLACVNAPVKLLGYSLGLLYAMYFASIRLAQIASFYNNCVFFNSDLTHLYPLVELPTYITLLLICLWYAINTFGAVRKVFKWYACNTLLSKEKKTHRYILRVKKLLTKSHLPPQNEEGLKNKIASIIYRWYKQEGLKNKVAGLIYKYGFDPSFHYPLGFSSAILISAICIYQLAILLTIFQLSTSRWLSNVLENFEDLITALSDSTTHNLYTYIHDISVLLEVVAPLVPITAGLFCLTLMFLMLINVRENVKQLCKSDSSFLPEKKLMPSQMMGSAMRYIGYQVGYFVWTWVIGILVLYVSVVLAFIYVLLLRIDHEAVISWTATLLVPVLISTVLYYGQVYFIKYFFLEDRGITLSLNNVKFFHWFQFMMIFFNIVVGLFSALTRNIYSLSFGLLLMPRLDHTVMMKGLEGWDSGYKTYIGFLHLNHYYNNAVVNLFCILLYNSVRPVITRKTLTIRDSNSELNKIAYQCDQIQRNQADSHVVKSQLSFNRWFVVYTLLKNPELQKLRGHAIAAANQTTVSDENKQSDICSESEIDENGKIDVENDKIELTILEQCV
ncbi:stimulated by retinoic acid gene 6 protein-like [Dysidea avara]|uniref:stimulated by retinoic acid gene 6 protein-like n=1 Tax=Dysidea avara TaxID=196820 RepID=UPI00331BE3D8